MPGRFRKLRLSPLAGAFHDRHKISSSSRRHCPGLGECQRNWLKILCASLRILPLAFSPESPKIADLMHQTSAILGTIAWFRSIRLLSELESRIVESLFEPCFEFAEAVKLAESIHTHIKVEDTETLPFDDFVQHG